MNNCVSPVGLERQNLPWQGFSALRGRESVGTPLNHPLIIIFLCFLLTPKQTCVAQIEDLSRCLSVSFTGFCIEGKTNEEGFPWLILGWIKEGRCSMWGMRVGVPARLQQSPLRTRGQQSTLPPSPDWVRVYFPSLGQLSPQAMVMLVLQEKEKSSPRKKISPQPIRGCACRSFALHICILKSLVMIFFSLKASIDVRCR